METKNTNNIQRTNVIVLRRKVFFPFNNESEKDTSMAGNWEPNNTLKVLCVLMCLYVPELKTRVFSTQNIVFVYISTYKKWEIYLRKKNKNNILSGTICHGSWLSISIIRFVFFPPEGNFAFVSMMFSNSYWLNLKTSAQCTFPFFSLSCLSNC